MNTEILPWILTGLLIPFSVTLIFLILILFQVKWEVFSPSVISVNNLPSDLPPALVGLLFEKRISPRHLTATLIDLANRGYLILGRDKERIFFAQGKKLDKNLRDFEKVLLLSLFEKKEVITSFKSLHFKSEKHLFSHKIYQFYQFLNQEALTLELFRGNPYQVRMYYKIWGLLIYLLSSLMFLFIFLFDYNRLYLWPVGGVLFSAILILKYSHLFPTRDIKGHLEYLKWWRFRVYLRDNLLPQSRGSLSIDKQFYQYLPYALAFGLEKKWISKFQGIKLNKPIWLRPPEKEISDLNRKIFQVLHRLSVTFSLLRGPEAQ